MSERKLATIRTIDDVTPIEGADKIESYHIGGWVVVDQKGLYKKGDKILYLEIDSCIPLDNPHFEFLKRFGSINYNGKLCHRLKTIKLKGQVSQGLIVPLSVLDGLEIKENYDYANDLGITKYEIPLPAQLKGKVSNWPSWIEKTDETRIQTLASDYKGFLNAVLKEKLHWIPYQKIDGTSITIYATDEKIGICSRNYELLEDNSTYWELAKKIKIKVAGLEWDLFNLLKSWVNTRKVYIVLQGELFGEGIQKNPLGIKGQDIRFFTIQVYNPGTKQNRRLSIKEIIDDDVLMCIYDQKWVPVLDIELPSTLDEIISRPDGIKSKIGNESQIEGIVWRHNTQPTLEIPKEKKIDISKIPEDKREMVLAKIGNPDFDEIKASFKCISNDYLLRHDS